MKECITATIERKCINCIAYNRHAKEGKVNENHSALIKDCPAYMQCSKDRDNIDY